MLNLLRKLGILRYGTKSYKYTSGRDMPARALMDDVYDEEKDLVNKQDIEKVREGIKTPKGKKTLKWIILGILGFLGVFFQRDQAIFNRFILCEHRILFMSAYGNKVAMSSLIAKAL